MSFQSYFIKSDPNGCHSLIRDHVFEETEGLLNELAEYAQIDKSRIHVQLFSDLTRDPNFQVLLSELFGTDEGRKLIKDTILQGDRNKKTNSLLAPICLDCGYSSTKLPSYHVVGDELFLKTRCYNDDCNVDKFEVNLIEPGRVNFNYLLDIIRDAIPNWEGKNVDLHIFGRDYGHPYGATKFSKGTRLLEFMEHLVDHKYCVYVGPLVICEGQKVSKSQYRKLTVASLRSTFQDWVQRLDRMVQDNPKSSWFDLAYLPEYFPFPKSPG